MKALILSSGGVDSTTCIGMAVDRYGNENVASLSAYYGQRHDKELDCAKKIAEYYKIKHLELNLEEIFKNSDCALLSQSSKTIPEGSYNEQIKQNKNDRVATYVPFRNGLLLATAASVADSLFPDEEVVIMYGAHADDYADNAYADCSIEFSDAMDKAIQIGTYNKIHLEAPLINIDKTAVVKKGLELKVPYELTWSCYKGGDLQCGKCATCIDRKKAFENNGVEDPVKYRKDDDEKNN